MSALLPALGSPADRLALAVGDRELTYARLASAAGALGSKLAGAGRVAVWAEPSLETCVAVVAALCCGVTVVPVNPRVGARELKHIVEDSRPAMVVGGPGEGPGPLSSLERLDVDLEAAGELLPGPDPEAPAFILYTSGTTGPPKGAVLSRRAVAFDLDALASAWEWTPDDVLVHGLPLFHVHGLILGLVGPLRVGGTLRHTGRFSPEGLAAGLHAGGTMVFGVPTMYTRIVDALRTDPALAASFREARLLVSGSAALPATVHRAVTEATGQQISERYGLTETIINCAVRASGARRPGYVGPPLDGIELRLLDEGGDEVSERDDAAIGEVHVRGANLFDGYLNRPDATAEAMAEGWFATGDLATIAPDGYVRIVGRKQTDLIKTGGYKVGAGEIENALLEHPGVAEAAVVGEPDDDLGERIVAYVVAARADRPRPGDLIEHVSGLLSHQKRPREVRLVDSLPRNDMGKVQKAALKAQGR